MPVLQKRKIVHGKLILPILLTLFLSACAGVIPDSSGSTTNKLTPTEEVITNTIRQMALVAEQKKDYSLALNQYQKLYSRVPTDENAILGLARNFRYVGASAESIRILKANKIQFTNEQTYLGELGKSFIAANRNTEALETLELAVKTGTSEWHVYSALGIVYDLHEMFDKSSVAYKTALDLSPGNPEVYNNLAFSYALRGNLEEAIQILNREAPKKPSGIQLRQNLAFFYCLTGDLEKAERLSRMDLDVKDVRKNSELCLQMNGN